MKANEKDLGELVRHVIESTDPETVFESPVWEHGAFLIYRPPGYRFVCVGWDDPFDAADACEGLIRAGLRFEWDGEIRRFLVPDEQAGAS